MGDPLGVDPPRALPRPGVAGEEGRDVAEVGRALQRAGARLDRVGVDPGGLQLVEQTREGAWEAGTRGGAPQRSQPPRLLGRPTATTRSRCAFESSAPGGTPAAVATVRNSAPKVIVAPPSTAPPSQSSRSNR